VRSQKSEGRRYGEHGNAVDVHDVVIGQATREVGDDDPRMTGPRSFFTQDVNRFVPVEAVEAVEPCCCTV
jgi:hypothetical protein